MGKAEDSKPHEAFDDNPASRKSTEDTEKSHYTTRKIKDDETLWKIWGEIYPEDNHRHINALYEANKGTLFPKDAKEIQLPPVYKAEQNIIIPPKQDLKRLAKAFADHYRHKGADIYAHKAEGHKAKADQPGKPTQKAKEKLPEQSPKSEPTKLQEGKREGQRALPADEAKIAQKNAQLAQARAKAIAAEFDRLCLQKAQNKLHDLKKDLIRQEREFQKNLKNSGTLDQVSDFAKNNFAIAGVGLDHERGSEAIYGSYDDKWAQIHLMERTLEKRNLTQFGNLLGQYNKDKMDYTEEFKKSQSEWRDNIGTGLAATSGIALMFVPGMQAAGGATLLRTGAIIGARVGLAALAGSVTKTGVLLSNKGDLSEINQKNIVTGAVAGGSAQLGAEIAAATGVAGAAEAPLASRIIGGAKVGAVMGGTYGALETPVAGYYRAKENHRPYGIGQAASDSVTGFVVGSGSGLVAGSLVKTGGESISASAQGVAPFVNPVIENASAAANKFFKAAPALDKAPLNVQVEPQPGAKPPIKDGGQTAAGKPTDTTANATTPQARDTTAKAPLGNHSDKVTTSANGKIYHADGSVTSDGSTAPKGAQRFKEADGSIKDKSPDWGTRTINPDRSVSFEPDPRLARQANAANGSEVYQAAGEKVTFNPRTGSITVNKKGYEYQYGKNQDYTFKREKPPEHRAISFPKDLPQIKVKPQEAESLSDTAQLEQVETSAPQDMAAPPRQTESLSRVIFRLQEEMDKGTIKRPSISNDQDGTVRFKFESADGKRTNTLSVDPDGKVSAESSAMETKAARAGEKAAEDKPKTLFDTSALKDGLRKTRLAEAEKRWQEGLAAGTISPDSFHAQYFTELDQVKVNYVLKQKGEAPLRVTESYKADGTIVQDTNSLSPRKPQVETKVTATDGTTASRQLSISEEEAKNNAQAFNARKKKS